MFAVQLVGPLQSCHCLIGQSAWRPLADHLYVVVRPFAGHAWGEKRLNRESLNADRLDWKNPQKKLCPLTTGDCSGNEEMRRATVEISKLTRLRQWQNALSVFEEFPNPDAALSSAAMNACAKSLQVEAAQEIFERMPSKTGRAYNILIALLGRVRRVAEAERLLDDMQGQKLEPNHVTFTSLIDGYGMVQDAAAVSAVRAKMRALNIGDTSLTCGAAIAACAKAGSHERVQELLAEMTAQSLKPDLRHMTSVVLSYTSQNDEAGAQRAFAQLKQCGCEPDVVAYTALMQCFVGSDALRKCEVVWSEMIAAGVKPDGFAHNGLLRAALESQAYDRFQEILSEIDERLMTSETYRMAARASHLSSSQGARYQEMSPAKGPSAELPHEWHATLDPASGRHYYWSEADPAGTTTWERPTAM